MRLSPPAARVLTRFGIAPLLDPRLSVGLRRRLLDVSGTVSPPPRGTRHASGVLGGVLTTVTVTGRPGVHRVLYLHGGGYQVASARAYRGLLAHLSRATGAPVHAPDYRLAPEHPVPGRSRGRARRVPRPPCALDMRHNASRSSVIPRVGAWR